MVTDLTPIDDVERSFLSNLERGEQALSAAETDYERMEVRDAARAAQVVTTAMGRTRLVRRFSVLVQRAERAIAKANPSRVGRPVEGGNNVDLESTLTRDTLNKMRQAHDKLSDEEFESLAAEETDEPMSRQQLLDVAKEKRLEEKRETRAEERAHIIEQAEAVVADMGQVSVYTSAIADLHQHVPEASVDAIVTDPPYERAYLEACWQELAPFADYALKPGGALIVMMGQGLFLDYLEALRHPDLTYRWMIAYLLPRGGLTFHRPYGVSTSWKPCVVYTKRGADIPDGYATDVVNAEAGRNANDKRLHDWGQNEAGLGQILLQWVPAKGLICDPFCGSGSTLIAAAKLGYQVCGGDIDTTAVNLTNAKLEEVKDGFQQATLYLE